MGVTHRLNMFVLRPRSGWFRRDIGDVVTAFPTTPVFVYEVIRCLRVNVTDDDDRRIFRPVPAFEEQPRVFQLLGHCLDVLGIAHGDMAVRMNLE